jgi:hypothetical protein
MPTPPPSGERAYVVDRIDQAVAVLIDEQGRTASVPVDRLPAGTGEGVVLRIPVEQNVLNWSQAMIDRAATERRRDAARQAVEERQEQGPAGAGKAEERQ